MGESHKDIHKQTISGDDRLDVPVDCDCDQELDETEYSNMSPEDYAQVKMHCLNGAQAAADSGRIFVEALRLDYIQGKDNLSLPESLGPRYIQGPHPQYGTPDGK